MPRIKILPKFDSFIEDISRFGKTSSSSSPFSYFDSDINMTNVSSYSNVRRTVGNPPNRLRPKPKPKHQPKQPPRDNTYNNINGSSYSVNRNTMSSNGSVNYSYNQTAKSIGFKDAVEFDNFIQKIDPHKLNISETQKVSKLYSFLSKLSRSNKSRGSHIAKLAIAGGTITAMIIFLQNFQRNHSGCFRYERNKFNTRKDTEDGDETRIKYKFDGKSWCNNNVLGGGTSENKTVKTIPESEHPLYYVDKWDCNYKNFPLGNERVDRIINMGCNGLCNWENFNFLATLTQGQYQPLVDYDETRYVYKCETVSFLQAVSSSTGDAISHTFSGLFNSDLGQQLVTTLFRVFFIMILIYVIFKICTRTVAAFKNSARYTL